MDSSMVRRNFTSASRTRRRHRSGAPFRPSHARQRQFFEVLAKHDMLPPAGWEEERDQGEPGFNADLPGSRA